MELRIRPLLLSLAISLAAAGAQATPQEAGMAPSGRALQALYWEGHDALQRADWKLALERFRRLEAELREKEPQSTDAAVYWQAYALAQAGRSAEARAEVERLGREFPASRWQADATALLRGASAAAATPAATASADPELAEAAIEGLLHAPAERALPILKRVLASGHSDKVKERALFVLGQLDSAAAIEALQQVAASGSPRLQREAVRMLGISGSPQALETLQAVYRAQPALREEVLHAWMVAGADGQVLAAARGEADPELREEAVRMLGVMGADQALEDIYAASKEASVREAVVQAWGVSGASDRLERVARSDADPGVRRDALHALGVAGAADALVRLYRESQDAKVREEALQGLLVAGDSRKVLEIYRAARSPEEKKEALRILSIMDDDIAIEAIEEALR